MSETKLYARLRVKTGEYESDGKTKNRYSDVGVLFASEHFNNMFIQLETLPLNKDWDGRIFVNPIEENKIIQTADDFPDEKHQQTHELNKRVSQDVVLEDIDDKPIELSKIPF